MAKHNLEELESLEPYCISNRQLDVLKQVINANGSGSKAAKSLKINRATVNKTIVRIRKNAAKKGWSPEHDMVFPVPDTYNVKRVSTLRGSDGSVTAQWTIAEPEKVSLEEQIRTAVDVFKDELPVFQQVPTSTAYTDESLLNVFVANDLHLGALVSEQETGQSCNLETGLTRAKSAIEYLVQSSPAAKQAVVVDLGDLTEATGYKPFTNKGGHVLDVSNRYPEVLRAAYELLAYFVGLALTKHETIYFYNVGGNHDENSALAVREVLRVMFRDNPRVIVDDKPTDIKYHQHGKTLLQFFHGDKMKMQAAGEVMAYDCVNIFSQTEHRYGLCGHIHKDAVVDGRLSRTESFRTLTVMNNWATGMGFRGGVGTMSSITYSSEHGEISRNKYSVTMN